MEVREQAEGVGNACLKKNITKKRSWKCMFELLLPSFKELECMFEKKIQKKGVENACLSIFTRF